ncbi:unnamed protein product [Linum trigynum]|uniref:Uncharacterized protein n=1 Tax=Linum trigynum TaxID=586398 RepID=A0AAV2GCS3_9ROSI
MLRGPRLGWAARAGGSRLVTRAGAVRGSGRYLVGPRGLVGSRLVTRAGAVRGAVRLGRAGWWVAPGDAGWWSARRGPRLGWAARAARAGGSRLVRRGL